MRRVRKSAFSGVIKATRRESGIRAGQQEGKRLALFLDLSLGASVASYVEVDKRYTQKQLGHALAELTRRYQHRRDRFRVNLTRAAGLW